VDPAARFGGLALLPVKGAAEEPEDPNDEEKGLFKGKCRHRGKKGPLPPSLKTLAEGISNIAAVSGNWLP
jgi:hypothetical protein